MKVILLSHTTAAHCFGGVETHVHAFARSAVSLGHQVVLIAAAHPRGIKEEMCDGVRIEYLPGTSPSVASRSWREASAAAVRRLQSQGFGDLLLSFSLAGYGAAKARVAVPHYAFAYGESLTHLISEWNDVSGVQGFASYPKRALAMAYCGFVERRLWPLLDGVLATYDGLYEKLTRLGYRTHLAYNGIAVARFRRNQDVRHAARQSLGIRPSSSVLLMVATVNRQKGIWLGVDTFLELAERHPDLHLLVVGDGPDLSRLDARLQRAPCAGRAHLVGKAALDDVPALYMASDVFLYPTLRMEGLPLAILEALAAELPVIASDRGGIGSAITHGVTGVLFEPGDGKALTQAVEQLLQDPVTARSMAQAGRERASSTFEQRHIAMRLLNQLRAAT